MDLEVVTIDTQRGRLVLWGEGQGEEREVVTSYTTEQGGSVGGG